MNSFHLFPHLIEEIYFAELARFDSVFCSVAIGLRAVTVRKSEENRHRSIEYIINNYV